MKNDTEKLQSLLDRLNRLVLAEDWADTLNPAQRMALSYLAMANRFSRSPSHVADYLCTTRGTASQTLKALERKGFIEKITSAEDKRSISYAPTAEGVLMLKHVADKDSLLAELADPEIKRLEETLSEVLKIKLTQRGFKTFGECQSCQHHKIMAQGSLCDLLKLPLTADESTQICHEHTP